MPVLIEDVGYLNMYREPAPTKKRAPKLIADVAKHGTQFYSSIKQPTTQRSRRPITRKGAN